MNKKTFFAPIFKIGRDRLGLTQVELAKALHCSQSRLSKIEDGKLEPGAGDLWWLMNRVIGERTVKKDFEPLLPKECL